MEYTPISRKEILDTLVAKFGAVEVVRYFLTDALSDLQSMGVGIAEGNTAAAASYYGSIEESLKNIRALIEKKENKGSIEKEIKNNLA